MFLQGKAHAYFFPPSGIRREQSVLLAEALGQLPEEWRELLILRHLEGLSLLEAARRMGRTTG